MKVHFDIQDDVVNGLDIRLDPAEGLILHSALLQYTNELKNNEVNRAIALHMCDAYLEAIGKEQTDRMTEKEFDTMLAKVLVGQTDCSWR